MNRGKRIVDSFRFVKTIVLTQTSPARSLHFEVIQRSHSPPFCSSSLQKQASNNDFFNTHQKLYFSSKPNSIVEFVTSNEWSEDLEKELEKSRPTLTHESVLYVLKRLDRNPRKASNFFNWVSNKHGFKISVTVYYLMLRILANKETMREFWLLIRKMSDEGFDVDEETYVTVLNYLKSSKMMRDAIAWTQCLNKMSNESTIYATVNAVVDVVLGSNCNDDVKKQLGGLEVTLSENAILKITRALHKVPLKALGFFRWVEEHKGYTHNTVTYNSILRVLSQEESIEMFWGVVKELKSVGHDIDIDTYVKITRQFKKNQMMKDAVELYELMMDSLYKPSVTDCSTLLHHISSTNAPDIDLASRVFKKYEETGNTLSKAVYDGFHRSLTSVGRFDEAEKISDAMRNAGYEPDNITYSQIVFGLCKVGRVEEGCKMLDEMEAQGCVPDIKTWTILIKGLCIASEIDQALNCFTKMLEKKFEADANLLEVLVHGLCNKERVNSAYTLVIETVGKTNLRPRQAMYKILINKLLGERKLNEAMNLLHFMIKHQYAPFVESVVEYISKFGTVDDAREFLKAVTVQDFPSSSSYARILESLFKEGRQSEARDLLYQCPPHIRNHADILNIFASAA